MRHVRKHGVSPHCGFTEATPALARSRSIIVIITSTSNLVRGCPEASTIFIQRNRRVCALLVTFKRAIESDPAASYASWLSLEYVTS
jgi:hypothetical protein